MKILLASLMCLVLCSTECFALKGGPVYPVGTNIVGNYAGVLQGVFDPTNPASSNSLGIFSLGVPATGTATGVFVMFSRGRVFTGTAQAFADPVHASLKGILSATFNYTLSTFQTNPLTGAVTVVSTSVTASAIGPISATVAKAGSSSFNANTTVLRGDATLSISQGGVASNGDPIITSNLALVVFGVKQ
jgi:hypothetical protein